MISSVKLTQGFWAKVVLTTKRIISWFLMTSLSLKILENFWSNKKPSYNHLHVFHCEAFAHVPKKLWGNLELKSQKCILIGYGNDGLQAIAPWFLQSQQKAFMSYSMSLSCINNLSRNLRKEDLLLKILLLTLKELHGRMLPMT